MFDAQGNLLYSIDAMGYVRNPKNRTQGQYTEGQFFTKNRQKAATVSNGVIRDYNGNEIARVGQDGRVSDGNGKMVGMILPNGEIKDKGGSKIGSYSGVDKNVVAIMFFFPPPK
jgi:hypothetical protein